MVIAVGCGSSTQVRPHRSDVLRRRCVLHSLTAGFTSSPPMPLMPKSVCLLLPHAVPDSFVAIQRGKTGQRREALVLTACFKRRCHAGRSLLAAGPAGWRRASSTLLSPPHPMLCLQGARWTCRTKGRTSFPDSSPPDSALKVRPTLAMSSVKKSVLWRSRCNLSRWDPWMVRHC